MRTLLTLALCLSMASLIMTSSSPGESSKLVVVTSIAPLSLIAREIGGSFVETYIILPPKADPHEFYPSIHTIELVKRAKLFVHTGHFDFEREILRAVDIKDVGKRHYKEYGLKFVYYPSSLDVNIHGYWLDPDNAIAIAKAIEEALEEVDPDHAEYYRSKLAEFISKMRHFKEIAKELVDEIDLRDISVVITLPIEEYFVASLGVEVKEVIMKYDIEPSARKMEELVEILEENKCLVTMCELALETKASKYAYELISRSKKPLALLRVIHVEDFDTFSSLLYYNLGSLTTAASMIHEKEVSPSYLLLSPQLYNALIIALLIIAIAEFLLILRLARA